MIKESFDISHPEAQDMIMADRQRTAEAHQEDIDFVMDIRERR